MILILLALLRNDLLAQIIPNGDFEAWEMVDGILSPVDWNINDPVLYRKKIERSADCIQGTYCSKIDHGNVRSYVEGCSGALSTFFRLDDIELINVKFSFWAKSITRDYGYLPYFRLWFNTWFESQSIDRINMEMDPTIDSNYQYFEYKLKDGIIDFVYIQFASGASGGFDDCVHHTNSWVDDVKITTTVNTSEILDIEYQIFPNPAREDLRIRSEKTINEISIRSIAGHHLLKNVYAESIDVSHLNSGLYIVDILFHDGHRIVEKFLKK